MQQAFSQLANARWWAASSPLIPVCFLFLLFGRHSAEASRGSAEVWIHKCGRRGMKEAWEMHNRGFCVGNSVTSGRMGSRSMALREAQKHCLVQDRKRGGRSIDQAFMERFLARVWPREYFIFKKVPVFPHFICKTWLKEGSQQANYTFCVVMKV